MRPYLAIIKDSFREALASRVLWILLSIITLKLVLLAPLTVRVNLTTDFTWGRIAECPRLLLRRLPRGNEIGRTLHHLRIDVA